MWAGIHSKMVTQKHGLTEQLLNSNEHFLSFVVTHKNSSCTIVVKNVMAPFYVSGKQVRELGIQI